MSEKKIDLGQRVEVFLVVKNAKAYEGEIGISITQFITINASIFSVIHFNTYKSSHFHAPDLNNGGTMFLPLSICLFSCQNLMVDLLYGGLTPL